MMRRIVSVETIRIGTTTSIHRDVVRHTLVCGHRILRVPGRDSAVDEVIYCYWCNLEKQAEENGTP